MKVGAKALVGALVAICCLVVVPGAGAAPTNDDFADRQVLAGPLPIVVPASNAGATKEEGEYLKGLPTAAGHSIWFEWESPSSEWVTIGVCDSDFRAKLAIATGTELKSLTPVVGGNADEGPRCLYSESQYTFEAQAGADYLIAVDGDAFRMPEAPAPISEGQIALRIESTPTPPNDDFVNATPLNGRISEEPGGNRVYFADSRGYNWTASTEPGEPFLPPLAGASVWYSWTAPESGTYRFNGPCCNAGLKWAMYSGDSLGGLSPVLVGADFAEMAVSAGTTYRFVVYGPPDPITNEPLVGSFEFGIWADLPPLPVRAPESPGAGVLLRDLVAPGTTIDKREVRTKDRAARFTFSSSERGSAFRCKLDQRKWTTCKSPKAYAWLAPGTHAFKAFAVDAAGNADKTPAVARFSIPRLRPRG